MAKGCMQRIMTSIDEVRRLIHDQVLTEQLDGQYKLFTAKFAEAVIRDKSRVFYVKFTSDAFEYILQVLLQNFKVSVNNNVYSTSLDRVVDVETCFGFSRISCIADWTTSSKLGTWVKLEY